VFKIEKGQLAIELDLIQKAIYIKRSNKNKSSISEFVAIK